MIFHIIVYLDADTTNFRRKTKTSILGNILTLERRIGSLWLFMVIFLNYYDRLILFFDFYYYYAFLFHTKFGAKNFQIFYTLEMYIYRDRWVKLTHHFPVQREMYSVVF